MIQAKELRIGNWVDGGFGFFQVIPTTIQQVSLGRTILKPIPLTEEILLKAGFVKDIYYSVYRNSINFELQVEKNGFILCVDENAFDITNTLYLHQLQNLYFALTGQELEIKFTDAQPAK